MQCIATTAQDRKNGITYLYDRFTVMVISHTKLDCIWIMAHRPTIPEEEYDWIFAYVGAQGYDTTKLQKAPQRTPDKRD